MDLEFRRLVSGFSERRGINGDVDVGDNHSRGDSRFCGINWEMNWEINRGKNCGLSVT